MKTSAASLMEIVLSPLFLRHAELRVYPALSIISDSPEVDFR
jgi:hypothetical protein